MEAEEHKAPQVGRPSCWDLDPIIQRLVYLFGALRHCTSRLSRSDPSRVLFAPIYTTKRSDTLWLFHGREKVSESNDHNAPVAVTHLMFSHRVEERKGAHDKRLVISIFCYSDGQILFKSPVSSCDLGHFPLKMENSSTGERNQTLVPLSQTVSISIRWLISVGKTYDICTSVESLVV